jgi:hypothetical protein
VRSTLRLKTICARAIVSRLTGTPAKCVGRVNATTADQAIERQVNEDG